MTSFAQAFNNISDKFHVRYLKKKHSKMQLEVPELTLINNTIKDIVPANILVFGMGFDTAYWLEFNQGGKTIFLENDEEWFNEIVYRNPKADAYKVDYPNDITQWESLLEKPSDLKMNLPEEVMNIEWDVIFVDAPQGWKHEASLPGRMSSIYMASQLVKEDGFIFVHDVEREVEKAYAEKYLGSDNLVSYVNGRARLNVYQLTKTPALQSA